MASRLDPGTITACIAATDRTAMRWFRRGEDDQHLADDDWWPHVSVTALAAAVTDDDGVMDDGVMDDGDMDDA